MNTHSLEVIEKHVHQWQHGSSPLVIAVDGYAGSGKTTVAEYLGKSIEGVQVVSIDPFIAPLEERIAVMNSNASNEEKAEFFEHQYYRYADLIAAIQSFKSGDTEHEVTLFDFDKKEYYKKILYWKGTSLLLIEGIFTCHPEHELIRYIDKRIFLTTPWEIADQRRVDREMQKWGEEYLPEDHQDNWTRYFKLAYSRYIQKYPPESLGDILFTHL